MKPFPSPLPISDQGTLTKRRINSRVIFPIFLFTVVMVTQACSAGTATIPITPTPDAKAASSPTSELKSTHPSPEVTRTTTQTETARVFVIATYQSSLPQPTPIQGSSTPLIPTYAPVTPTSEQPATIHVSRAREIQLLANLEGNTLGAIQNVLWHPETSNLLIQSNRSLFMLNPSTGQILWNQPNVFNQLVFSPDGGELLGIRGGELQRLDPASGKALSSIDISIVDGIFTVSPVEGFIASTLGSDVTLFDPKTRQSGSLPADPGSGPILDLAFSADGKWMIAGSQNGDVHAWEVTSGQLTKFQPVTIPSEVYYCQVSGARDHQMIEALILVCSYPTSNYQTSIYQVGIYQASPNAAGRKLELRGANAYAYDHFAINADFTRLAAFTGKQIEIWNAESKNQVRTFKDAAGIGMAFDPKTTHQLAVWSQNAVVIWDVNTGTKTREWQIPGAVEPPVQIAFSPAPGQRLLVVARESGLLERWDLHSQKKTGEWQARSISTLAFSSNGASLAVGQPSGVVTLFNMATDGLVPQAEFQVGFAINAIAFAPNAPTRLFIAGKSHHVHIWDVEKRVESGVLQGSNLFELTTLDLRGGVLAAGTSAGRVVLWRVAPQATPFTELAFSSMSRILSSWVGGDEQQVIFTQNNVLKIWDAVTKKRVHEITFRNVDAITAQPAPDGCTIAVQTGFSVDVLDTHTLGAFTRFSSPARLTGTLAFSSDGMVLAAGTKEGGLLLWGVPGALQAHNGPLPALSCRTILAPTSLPGPTITPRPFAILPAPAQPVITPASATKSPAP